ncbi:DUF6188 family protein [Streptomyces kebangsaanensis]|uniref:DUF6188 family protein n=1 Tax=Streptomyces kebangsaanensis TaxID=864058 RepID=UPI00389A0A86
MKLLSTSRERARLSSSSNRERPGGPLTYFNGTCTLLFTQGVRISVPSNPDFEAWTYTSPSGRTVCMPGGDLAVWTSADLRHRR